VYFTYFRGYCEFLVDKVPMKRNTTVKSNEFFTTRSFENNEVKSSGLVSYGFLVPAECINLQIFFS